MCTKKFKLTGVIMVGSIFSLSFIIFVNSVESQLFLSFFLNCIDINNNHIITYSMILY